MKKIEAKVKARQPEFDINDVCDQYYNRPTRNGQTVNSLMQVFSRSIKNKGDSLLAEAAKEKAQKQSQLRNKGNKAENGEPLFNLTLDSKNSKRPMAEERSPLTATWT